MTDPPHFDDVGNVTYQDRANATSKRLAYVNDAGHAIIKVDNTTTLARDAEVVNRDSVSDQSYIHGF